ncbi:hypothetical protein [Saccharothrix sp. Mg75]|uniref:hypothetical protein n=1 Tax=Saccharothrix sp. Mg75 TaxID=3445357 RepID=UPI003EE909CD
MTVNAVAERDTTDDSAPADSTTIDATGIAEAPGIGVEPAYPYLKRGVDRARCARRATPARSGTSA